MSVKVQNLVGKGPSFGQGDREGGSRIKWAGELEARPNPGIETENEAIMNIKELMTTNPVCCTPETGLADVARMMVERDCGEIPVVQSNDIKIPVGVVTDRDIVCRTLAKGMNPLDMRVNDCLTSPAITVTTEASVEDACEIMEKNQIRRVPVTDERGEICGIISLGDLAEEIGKKDSGEVLRKVSEPTASASTAAR